MKHVSSVLKEQRISVTLTAATKNVPWSFDFTAIILEANAMLFSNVSVRPYGLSNKEESIQTSYQDKVGAASVISGGKYKNKIEYHF